MTPFSARLPEALAPNALARAVARLRAAGERFVDLTESNPTAVGFPAAPDQLGALADPAARCYQPEPLGLASARESVSADYARRGLAVNADRIMLTASTSEAYAFLFKLLCNPGDAVLVPQPSYPLFELLTRLEGIEAHPYRLEWHGAWSIDRETLVAALTPRTRAVLVVSPNNPTGSLLRADDRDWLAGVCERHEMAMIGDEVFADYPLRPRPDGSPVLGDDRVLAFSLGGLSKSAGLPQVKLGWLAAAGPARAVNHALARLEVIADIYLSVSTPVQVAAPALIASGATTRAAIGRRLARNLQQLRAKVAGCPPVSLLEPEGGWSAVLRVPATQSEEALVLRLLAEARVLVHPGYFFDFSQEAFLVVSLLPDPDQFAHGVDQVLGIAVGDGVRSEA